MRIECIDIQRAISGLLSDKGFIVFAPESAEGGTKPYCCVEVLPAQCELHNDYIEQDTYSAAVAYFPKQETQAELLTAADKLRRILLFNPLRINGRVIGTESVTFDKDDSGNVLIVSMSYEFEQETGFDSESDDVMMELDFDMDAEEK